MDETCRRHIDSETKRVPWISIAALGILLCLTPVAMMQEPNIYYQPGVAPWPLEVQYALMLAGMACAIFSVAEALILLPLAWKGRAYGTLCAGLAFTNLIIGYRTFPYWSIGIYQLYLAGDYVGRMEPNNWLHVPDSYPFWITWFVTMLFLLLLYWPFEVVLAGSPARALLRRRYLYASLWAPLFLARLVAIYALSPEFYTWFFD